MCPFLLRPYSLIQGRSGSGLFSKPSTQRRKGYAEFAKENLGLMSKIKETEDFVGMVE